MNRTQDVLRKLAREIGARPTGTDANEAANRYLEGIARDLGFEVTVLHFDCRRWEYGPSTAVADGQTVPIHPGPFSAPLRGRFPVTMVDRLEDLRRAGVTGRLLVIRGELAHDPLMPRDFPFYYPDEHREILDLLLEKQPAGVLALTGRHPMCGLSPFPLFEDGNLGLPNAYAGDTSERILQAARDGGQVEIELDSSSVPTRGRQLVFSRTAGPAGRAPDGNARGREGGRIVIAAHIDTKYETPGALDNAAGVATLVSVMERLREARPSVDVDIVPFNGEEYYEVSGQRAYLDYRSPSVETTRLMVNLDGLGHRDSQSAFSFYNTGADPGRAGPVGGAYTQTARRLIQEHPRMTAGEQWIAGDHAIFAFQGIPCIAVTSSNLMERVVQLTHTQGDTTDEVDVGLLDETAAVIAEVVSPA